MQMNSCLVIDKEIICSFLKVIAIFNLLVTAKIM